MTSVSIRFGGEIINELSNKIPTSLFALNELIKNAYDAFSPEVTITVIPSKNKITIIDKGNGMERHDIDSLFHVSRSTKTYGKEITQDGKTRITQGSKGLGFLSAFKFGDKVIWKTCKNGEVNMFSARKSDLVSRDDVSGVEIPITTDVGKEDGTEIIISTSKEEMDDLLIELSDNKISEKLVSSIINEGFNIKLKVENKEKVLSSNGLKLFKNESEENQLFYVKYNSFKGMIEFYHLGKLINETPFDISRSDYSVNVELIVFQFQKGRNSKGISALYKRVHDNALFPLVYVNNNLFNNVMLFDPDLLRRKKSSDTLAQIIGHVLIRSESSDIEFNSDRTNFVENGLTKSLTNDLRALNELIQTKGAELKKELKKDSKLYPTGKAFPEAELCENEIKVASISIDRKKHTNFHIPSSQIGLDDYIFQVRDSKGERVDKSRVSITINDEESSSRVLNSIEEPKEVIVRYRYKDELTGLVSVELILSFEKKVSNISGKVLGNSLFTLPSAAEYKIRLETVSDLIYAIDKAYSTKKRDEYLPLIACSIRAIFEISADKVLKKQKQLISMLDVKKFTSTTKREIPDSLSKNVVQIMTLVNKNNKLRTRVSEVLDISYGTFSNLIDVRNIKLGVKLSHVGAHQSTRFLSKPKIEECADACGFFAAVCDVLVHLDKDELSALHIVKVSENDINQQFEN